MKIEFSGDKIILDKEPTGLDQFCLDFCSLLNSQGISYVLVSGYVSILFGRTRNSEDIDLIMEKLPEERFASLWKALESKFECINAGSPKEAYGYLTGKETHALRFARPDTFIPNFEVKFPKRDLDLVSLEGKVQVMLNGFPLFIAPLEIQIPFKLWLGSDKDIEDALHLYLQFKDKISTKDIEERAKELGVYNKLEKLL